MSTKAEPLMAEEITELAAWANSGSGPWLPDEDTLLRLLATIDARDRDIAKLKSDMREVSAGSKRIVLHGGYGCLTDDCPHWDDDSCNSAHPSCHLGRTINTAAMWRP